MNSQTDTDYIFRSYVNSFHYLFQDAEYFHELARNPGVADSFEIIRICRTAVLLYILCMEGLINRALDHFLPNYLHDFFIEREERFKLLDKYLLLPLLASGDKTFDTSAYPWSHFSELVSIRNDFVHPKHDRPAYYKAISAKKWEALKWNQIPEGLEVKVQEIVYRQTLVPKDPYAIRPQHVDKVRTVIDDTISALDELLDGKIEESNWLHNDQMTLIFPRDAKLSDLPFDD